MVCSTPVTSLSENGNLGPLFLVVPTCPCTSAAERLAQVCLRRTMVLASLDPKLTISYKVPPPENSSVGSLSVLRGSQGLVLGQGLDRLKKMYIIKPRHGLISILLPSKVIFFLCFFYTYLS